MSLFLRLLEEEDKGAALLDAVRAVAAGEADGRVFEVDPESFEQVPGAPFAYWVSESVRKIFLAHPCFEAEDRAVRLGASTKYDFRFVRLWWEPPFDLCRQWSSYANGGRFSRFYCSYAQSIKFADGFKEIAAYLDAKFPYLKGNVNFVLHLENDYSRPAIAWPLRTHAFSPHLLPAHTVFSARTYAAFVNREELDPICSVLASQAVDYLLKLMLGRFGYPEFVTAVVRSLPWPDLDTSAFLGLARKGWLITRSLDTATLPAYAFVLPALLQVDGAALDARVAAWAERVQQTEQALAEIQAEIDERCFDLYGFDEADRAAALGTASGAEAAAPGADEEAQNDGDDADDDSEPSRGCDPRTLAAELFDWLVGVAFGRFDVRLATGERSPTAEPEPFDPLPLCSPGMLQGDDGLPLSAEEGRRQRAEGGYPIDIAWDGILVDDPEHPLDIERRVHDALAVIWGDRAGAIQQEACELLGVPTLREWFRRPAGFFADHLKRYSKSRRQAPIYWPLSIPDGRYTVWLYYHRFSKDTLYRALEQVQEKLDYEERKRSRLTADAGGNPGAAERAALADQESFVTGLRVLREELTRVAPLWSPDLNDGVILNYGPLWRMIGHTPWQKAVKAKWDELVAGKYDWAHLAMHLWPERVVPKCATDRSLAIAHGLEEVFWEKSSVVGGKSSVVGHQSSAGGSVAEDRRLMTEDRSANDAKPSKWQPRKLLGSEMDRLVAERTSAAVKDALKSLLEAPAPVAVRGGGRRTSGRGPARRASAGPRSGGSSGRAVASPGPAVPNAATLDAVKQAIASSEDGVSKSDVLAATGLTDAQWNVAINALIADGVVTKTGAARGTRYHLSPEPRTYTPGY